ncbi:MAG TPA: hypothetical protein VH559_06680 [Gemmatimonadaceae bacterium]|jgi:hypothetical protein
MSRIVRHFPIGVFALLALPGSLVGQATPQSLSITPITGFFGLEAAVTSFNSQTVATSGAELAVLFNHRVSVGVVGYGLVNRDVSLSIADRSPPDTLRMGYGGLRVGYRFAPQRPVHVAVNLFIGGGEVRARADGRPRLEDELFVAAPGVALEANLGSSLQGALGLSYRQVGGIDWPGVAASALRGPELRFSLRAGRF